MSVENPDVMEFPETSEFTFAEAMHLASQLHRGRQFEAAEKLYRALIELAPDDINLMHYLGVLLCQTKRSPEGLALIRDSLKRDPTVAAWHNNLGNAMLNEERFEEAVSSYEHCLEIDPDHPEVLNNLGVLQRKLGRLEDAEATLKRAVLRNPELPDAHHNLAVLCFAQRRIQEGMEHCANALRLKPWNAETRRILAFTLGSLGRVDEAAKIYREWLEHEPESEQARYLLAACTGDNVPERATASFVENLFDNFATSFDSKLAALDYQAPQLVVQAIVDFSGLGLQSAIVLDAGCGTGLCGPRIAPYASKLIGVDLSDAMLARARARDVYDELIKHDLVDFMLSQHQAYDLIISADTLCYFGNLRGPIASAFQALRPEGLICFTVESHQDADKQYILQPHGRYSHHHTYLDTGLRDAGFTVLKMTDVKLRMESGVPVSGWLVLARR